MADEDTTTWFQKARGFLRSRKASYQLTFEGETGRDVLSDLARFCRAHEVTFTSDERLSAVLEGRREVWLRIQHHLNLTENELWDLYQRGRKE